ncbi:MFS transporter [Rhizobium ruizarguesonis]|uniref:MFS transporter n=1 Tax=Rhizobium ruizarguesonis TaxID=2081791 RepID=UPI0013BF5158|nr:MFS transporter [Rhizobium ruizarguesonis]NEJ03490.1 MFS transporter [Rhizobium ruizarguesonis]NEJ40145.1 MFS transporter [Rhizobium ruizarguesonis]
MGILVGGLMGRYSARSIYLFCVVASAAGRNGYFVMAAWIATDVSNSASALAILLALGSAAELLTSNVGGALVDRFDRRLVCIGCDLSRLGLMLSTGLAFLFGDPLIVLYVSWTIFAIIDRTYSTALQAMIPSIVRPENLSSFNSVSYVAMQTGNLIAAIVMGSILAAIGRDLTPFLPGAFFSLSMLGLLAIFWQQPLSFSQRGSKRDSVRRLDLLPTTFTVHPLKAIAVIYALIYSMGMLVSVLGSAYVIHELEGSALQFGYLEAGWAFGSIAGCAIFLFGSALSRRGTVLLHLALAGIILSGFWVLQSFPVALVQMMFLGLSYNMARVLIDVRVQSTIPIGMMGRVRSQIHTICVAIGLLAYAIIGVIGDAFRPSEIFGLFGALMVAVALFFYFRMDRGEPLESRLV